MHEHKRQSAACMSGVKYSWRIHLCCTDEHKTDNERNRKEDSGKKRGWQIKSPARLLTLATKLVPKIALNNLRQPWKQCYFTPEEDDVLALHIHNTSLIRPTCLLGWDLPITPRPNILCIVYLLFGEIIAVILLKQCWFDPSRSSKMRPRRWW